MGGPEVEAFLTHLAAVRGLSVSSHRQALSALLFLYGKVLGRQMPWMDEMGRPVPKRRLPVVLSVDEVAAVLQGLDGVHGLLARLLYGAGLRIEEALQLRVKDPDFANQAIVVRSGKGGKDRVVMLPRCPAPALRLNLAQQLRAPWSVDRAAGCAGVHLPDALERKYPRAGCSWAWFWVFAQQRLSAGARSLLDELALLRMEA
jgi:integrase